MQPGEGDALKKVRLEDAAGTFYEFVVKGGDDSIQETPVGANPLTPGGARKYGDFSSNFGHIQMDSWERGFGGYDLKDDEYRFDWAPNMWTATKGYMFPVPAWVSTGYDSLNHITYWSQPGNMTAPLYITSGQSGWYEVPFTPATTGSIKYAYFWVKWDGAEGQQPSLVAEIYNDSAGDPGSSLGTSSTFTYQDEDYGKWVVAKVTFSSAVSVTASTAYHCVIKMDAKTDGSMANWLIGVCATPDAPSAQKSTDSGSSWGLSDTPSIYLHGAKSLGYWRFFELNKTPFRLWIRGATNELFMCGDHGVATAATSTTLTDTGSGVRGSWSTNQWAQDLLIIVKGTGAGQERTISSNTGTVITVSEAFNDTPDTTSEYAIISYDDWYKCPSTGIANSKSVTVAQGVAYFAEGYGGTIRRMRFNPTTSGIDYADDTGNDADILFAAGGKIYRGTDDDGKIAYADYQDWGTNLTFTDMPRVTDTSHNFTGAAAHAGKIHFFKEDTVYFWDANSTLVYEHPVSMKYFTGNNNAWKVVPYEEYLYFPWGASMERMNGVNVEHVNPNRDKGMPSDYRGKIYGLAPNPGGIFFAVNGGEDKISTVNIYDGVGFHNAFSSEMVGVEISDIAWHTTETGAPRLMIALGETCIIQKYPKDTTNPLSDDDWNPTRQGQLDTAVIDMGGKVIPKFFKELNIFCKNVNYVAPTSYAEILVYYNKDGAGWTYLTTVNNISRGNTDITFTDETLATINAFGNTREIQFRFVIIHDGSSPAQIYAVTLKGFARTPIHSVFSFPIDTSEVTEGLGSGDPIVMVNQFFTWAQSAEALLMTSQHPRLHNRTVIIIPRSINTSYIDRTNESYAADFYMEVREI